MDISRWVLEIAAALAIALIAIIALYFYYSKFTKLSHREALDRAVGLAYEIWKASDFAMPSRLLEPGVSLWILREAGLVLKAEVVGKSTYLGRLPAVAARPHPELIDVDPLELAEDLRSRLIAEEN